MAQRTCETCENVFPVVRRGRPRRFCLTCRPRSTVKAAPAKLRHFECAECGTVVVSAHSRQIYCSKGCQQLAKDKRKKNVPCKACGEPCYIGSTSSAQPTCHPCRRSRPGYRPSNMRARGMVQDLKCSRCTLAWTRPAVKGHRPKLCPGCRHVGWRPWIPATVRGSVYERDGWTCQICLEPVDAALVGSRSEWRPSLDHVIPRAAGGSDDAENLRLSHQWCNAVLNDGRAYTDDDFRTAR